MTPQEAVKLRKRLRKEIDRCALLSRRLMAQVADGDLPRVDRESAEHRALLTIKTRGQFETSLERINEALAA